MNPVIIIGVALISGLLSMLNIYMKARALPPGPITAPDGMDAPLPHTWLHLQPTGRSDTLTTPEVLNRTWPVAASHHATSPRRQQAEAGEYRRLCDEPIDLVGQ